MGRVSTCQKDCKTIDLRGAQVNETTRDVCQAPIKQNPFVPWAHLLSNNVGDFGGTEFKEIHVLPRNAFTAAPLIQVRVQILKYIASCKGT